VYRSISLLENQKLYLRVQWRNSAGPNGINVAVKIVLPLVKAPTASPISYTPTGELTQEPTEEPTEESSNEPTEEPSEGNDSDQPTVIPSYDGPIGDAYVTAAPKDILRYYKSRDIHRITVVSEKAYETQVVTIRGAV
jgi:hypothetical protein